MVQKYFALTFERDSKIMYKSCNRFVPLTYLVNKFGNNECLGGDDSFWRVIFYQWELEVTKISVTVYSSHILEEMPWIVSFGRYLHSVLDNNVSLYF